MRRSKRIYGWLGVVTIGLVGCSDDPSGPGSLEARFEGPVAVGAALIEVRGAGITSISGDAGTRVFTVEPSPDVYRVVVIGSTTATAFSVAVEDLSQPAPVASILSAADQQNEAIVPLTGFRVFIGG